MNWIQYFEQFSINEKANHSLNDDISKLTFCIGSKQRNH